VANSPSNIDFSVPLSTFLATAVSDGTWSDVISTTKVDEASNPAPASQIRLYAGQLWSNLMDDLFLALYSLNEGAKVYSQTTPDATPVDVGTLATLPADGDTFAIRVQVSARTDAAAGGEVLDAELGGLYYRASGVVLVTNPTASTSRVGLTTAAAELVISGDDVVLRVTGEAATNIGWTARAVEVREIPSP
jgi:hypothetical protein